MQFIDTHIHLQDFKEDFAPEVLESPMVRKLLVVSAQSKDFRAVGELMKKYPDKAAGAFGVHPWYAKTDDIELLRAYLQKFDKALLGEIGVDGIKAAPDEAQHRLFSSELELAKVFNRPVVIHGARAFEALKAHERELKEVKFSYHGFVKNRELLLFIRKCGGYFGLGAHFLRRSDAKEMLDLMPGDKILFETDAPYQVPDEGYLKSVENNLELLCAIKKESKDELSERLINNAEDFMRC